MIFWICVLVLVVAIVLCVIGNMNCMDGLEIGGGVTAFIMGIAVVIMCICLCFEYSAVDANIARNEEAYKAITYKVESGACRDELGLLSKEVIDEVQTWNKNVIYNQKIQDNFWVGIFYPNIYDQLKTIDYTKYTK